MVFQLTDQVIRTLCGRFSCERGEIYYREGKTSLDRATLGKSVVTATVNGKTAYRVSVTATPEGDLTAECTCPAFDAFDKYCEHVAATLYAYQAWSNDEDDGDGVLADEDSRLSEDVLSLFAAKPKRPTAARPLFDARDRWEAEFIVRAIPYGDRKTMFGLELKIGPKRLYPVPRIREFLEKIERSDSYSLAKRCVYDPELHCFSPDDDEIIRRLVLASRNERIYRDSKDDKLLQLPPLTWEALAPLLAGSPSVKLETPEGVYDGIRFADEPLPLSFEFDEDPEEGGYRLVVRGMDAITIMEAYGIVLSEGTLLKLPSEEMARLSALKPMVDGGSHQGKIRIPAERMEPFLEKVIPGLMKLGRVDVSEAVSDRMVRTPLKAKLYLDRVRDKLLAGLEFQYGDIVINPLEGEETHRGTDRILMRDGERERSILDLMEQSSFGKTESGYFMESEDAEYDFLHRVVPELEKLLHVFATSAVKTRLHVGPIHPKVKVDADERTDWLEFRFEMDGIPDSEVRGVLRSLGDKRRYHRLPNGALLPLEGEEFKEIIRFLNETGVRFDDWNGTELRLPLYRGLHLMDYDRGVKGISLGKSFRKLLENMRNPDYQEFPLPARLVPVLRDYQLEGFQWMRTLARYRFGGILADDMGLGKTIQSIAFIVSLLAEIRERGQPALIVAPASLVYNWRNELRKFAPEIQAVIADGSREEREGSLREGNGADVVITSYPLLRRDINLYVKQSFHTLILDEAQAFKNHATQTAQAVRAIAAVHRFALTGTPVENRLEELWSIVDAVFPELFESRKSFNEMSREAVAKRIRPFLLRRLKSDVLRELPDKIESLQATELLPEQKKLYVAYLAQLQAETVKHLSIDGYRKHRIKILAGLTRLRQICCHPALFVEGYEGSSAKFEQLLEIIDECRSAGKRPLVFSQFTEMLGLIGRELGYRGISHFYLDGQTPAAERVELCSRFNEGERELFLLSLKAGGTGLNLTGADTVILYDLWWNPAVEQQAADRAHRIGQKNVVQVIRLVAQGTVEEKMYALQQRKLNLIEEVIRPGQEALSSLTERDIRDILMID